MIASKKTWKTIYMVKKSLKTEMRTLWQYYFLVILLLECYLEEQVIYSR